MMTRTRMMAPAINIMTATVPADLSSFRVTSIVTGSQSDTEWDERLFNSSYSGDLSFVAMSMRVCYIFGEKLG